MKKGRHFDILNVLRRQFIFHEKGGRMVDLRFSRPATRGEAIGQLPHPKLSKT